MHLSTPSTGLPLAARTRVGRLAALASTAVVAIACGPPEDPAIAEGRALYEAGCEMCHGERGLGDGPMASSLPVPPVSLIEHVGHHSASEMYRLITDGIPPAMPPHTLSEEQVTRIVDYVWTLVPEGQVAALRDMQRQIEEMGLPAVGMPGMQMDPAESGVTTDSTTASPAPAR